MNFFKIISVIPLFLILLLIYNIMAFTVVDFNSAEALFSINLPSGAKWDFTWSSLFIMFGILALFFEIIKSTRTGTASIVDHVLSMIVFITFLVEFILVPKAGTSTFIILTLMSLLDVVAGFNITIAAARRDINRYDDRG
jgi:uncharacterized membrane protein YobD (UPF0266 family)